MLAATVEESSSFTWLKDFRPTVKLYLRNMEDVSEVKFLIGLFKPGLVKFLALSHI